ncbi:MAG TPA: tetratricopeptide repeat protein [Kofleriaceae bacterium]|nr:tetratricopeptide repeat protein [Kofleriaceae bacterium]
MNRQSSRARFLSCASGALAILVFLVGEAHADPIEERFAAAANLIAEDREAEAAAALEKLAREAPEHAMAPEALFMAADLFEDRLADPARALALYEELGVKYPDSRRALAASRRAAALSAQVGTGAAGIEAQRRFLAIRQKFAERPEQQSIQMGEALLREYPDWAGAPAVAMWLAGLDERAGRYESALRRYLEASRRYSEPEARFDALRGAGDMALHLGRHAEAEDHYRSMEARGDPARQIAIEEALAAVVQSRGRSRWLWACLVASAAGFLALGASLLRAAGGARAALRAMWPPPVEVMYLLPAGVLLSAVSYTDYQGLGPAVTIVSAGGVLAAWLSGAGLALRRERRSAVAIGHALLAGVAVLALLYVAVYTNNLIDPVADTLRYGPER